MLLTDQHLDTLKAAPFIIPQFPGVPHDLCRRGLLEWEAGAWRLTDAGRDVLAEQDRARNSAAA